MSAECCTGSSLSGGAGGQEGLWHEGWYRFAAWLPSPNFDPRPQGVQVTLVVMHSISLPPHVFGSGRVQQFFLNQLDWSAHPYFEQIRGQRVSSHFFIERDGRLTQFVSTLDRAWHAGRSLFLGRENCNNFSIGVEMEGVPGLGFAQAQYESLMSVLSALGQVHPVAQITSHAFVAPDRKNDPGEGFDWGLVRSMGLAVHA